MKRPGAGTLAALVLVLGLPARGQGTPSPQDIAPLQEAPQNVSIDLSVEPLETTVGDPIVVRLTLDVPADTKFDPPQLATQIGPFTILDGAWAGPEPRPEGREGGQRWTWTGRIAAYRTGAQELPAIRLKIEDAEGRAVEAATAPRAITIRSVLADEDAAEDATIADLKPPASIPPDYGPLLAASGVLALLLIGSAIAWWLHRRYAARLAAVPAPTDPFRRTPPHVWVYEELQKLLDRRLAEQGQVDLFFSELSRIVKLYLSGRFRVDLMERTTAEVPDRLRQAGTPESSIREIVALLERCDRVKFARVSPDPAACRAAVEEAYRIVDATKPAEVPGLAAERGAA